jgi:N-methylhydantoinase A
LQPARFLGGDFTLDLERARRLTREWLKKQGSNLTLEKFAAGMIRVVNAAMEKAIRVVSIERGRDPRQFALVAFGGAGGLHACALAEALSIPHVIVPALPGALSALGILASDVVKDYSRTILWRIERKIPYAKLVKEFAALEAVGNKEFKDENWQGRPAFRRTVDLRYRGQGYELNIPLTTNLRKDFEEEHHRRYGYTHPTREIELVTLRLRATLRTKSNRGGADAAYPERNRRHRPRAKRGVFSEPEALVMFEKKKLNTKLYAREELIPGKKYQGPAVVTEYSATTVIPPASRFHVDRAANLLISIR